MLLRDPIPRLDARLDPLPLEPSAWQRSQLKAQSHVLAVRRPMANPDAAVATYVVHDVLRYVCAWHIKRIAHICICTNAAYVVHTANMARTVLHM